MTDKPSNVTPSTEGSALPPHPAPYGEAKDNPRQLAKDWAEGRANTKSANYTTPQDRENPRTFDEDLAEAGEAPETQGGEVVAPLSR